MTRRKGSYGGNRRRPHAYYGDEPQMAEYPYTDAPNGASKNMVPTLREIIGGVNVTWAALVSVWIALGSIAGPLIVAGFLILPAKESDMKEARAAIIELQSATKSMATAITRLEENMHIMAHQEDITDRKIDRLIDLHLLPMQLSPASPPPMSPNQAERERLNKRMLKDDNTVR